jgi:hypothetical protein
MNVIAAHVAVTLRGEHAIVVVAVGGGVEEKMHKENVGMQL